MIARVRAVAAVVFSVPLGLGCQPRGGAASADAPTGDEHELTGVKAPSFSLPAQSGAESVSLEAEAGKVVIVDFWATWCKPCRDSFPYYQGLVEAHGGDVVVIGLSQDDDASGVAAFGAETGAEFPLAWDEDQAVARRYEPHAMPTSFLVDRNGFVQYVHGGFRPGDEAELDAAVASVLAR